MGKGIFDGTLDDFTAKRIEENLILIPNSHIKDLARLA